MGYEMSFVAILSIILGAAVAFLSWFIVRMVSAPRQTQLIAEQLNQGRPAAAVRTAKALLAKDPRNAVAHYYLGKAYLADGKHELALMEYKSVNQISHFGADLPETAFRTEMAALYSRFNQTEEALKEYILLTKLDPGKAQHFLDAGVLFEERGKTDVAVKYLRKAIEMDDRLSGAQHALGLIMYRTKHPIEAREALEAAIKGDQDDYEAHYYLGKVFKELNDYTSALLSFEKATRGPEYKLKALVERGGCYMSQGAIDKAIPELERAVRMIKDESATEALYGRYFLAMCHEKLRDLDKAIEQWERIYAKKPAFRDVAEKLTQYQEYRTDDSMKDFLTCGKEDFAKLCKSIVTGPMGLSIQDAVEIQHGVDIIAVEGDSEKWLAAKKLPQLVRFLRVSDKVEDGIVRSLIDQMKKLGVVRGSIVTSSGFTRAAMEFAENRSVELLTKEKLQELLKKTPAVEQRRR
jgi:tetratricopeptide (TPR) repeat protein